MQIQIKEGSRKLYIKAFNGLREHLGNDLETRPPSEEELLSYFKFLRLEKGLASSNLSGRLIPKSMGSARVNTQ